MWSRDTFNLRTCFCKWLLSGFTLSWRSTDLKETLIAHVHKFLMTFIFTKWTHPSFKIIPSDAAAAEDVAADSLTGGLSGKLLPAFHDSLLKCPLALGVVLQLSLWHTLQRTSSPPSTIKITIGLLAVFRCIYILRCSAMQSATCFFVKSTLSINLTSPDTQYWVH